MDSAKAIKLGLVLAMGAGLAGCSSIRETHGYVMDPILGSSIQPGVDNRQSVEGTLGRPSYISEYGEKTWFYISSINASRPFGSTKIERHTVLAIDFDSAGNVSAVDRKGVDAIARINPDGAETPTVGRERGFLEDLFGNIGQVGSGLGGAGAGQ